MSKKLILGLFFSIVILSIVYQRLIVPRLTKVISKDGQDVMQEFYLTGSLKSEVPIKKGIPNGLMKVFFRNGNLRQECMMKNGKRYQHSYEYFNSSDTINLLMKSDTILTVRSKLKRYEYTNEQDQINYFVRFDENNKVVETFGKTMPEYSFKKTEYFKGDTLNAMFILPQPWNVHYLFVLTESTSNDGSVKTDTLNVDYEHGVIWYNKIFYEAGEYQFCTISKLIFNDGYIDCDTMCLSLTVKGQN
jgi:hypothetical protein